MNKKFRWLRGDIPIKRNYLKACLVTLDSYGIARLEP